ncbi:hypothetical protein N9Y92_03745, partial [Chlamydiales bacterium]|nr:hypothetical protein [Chlamydiales bacterium]
ADWWTQNSNGITDLAVSNPDFNNAKTEEQKSAWKNLSFRCEFVNKPCFGDIAKNAAFTLEGYGLKVAREVDSFVLKKLVKAEPLIEYLKALGYTEIAERISAFVKDIVQKGPKIKTPEEWSVFLKSHNLPEKMELDFNSYLGNFDLEGKLTEEVVKDILQATFEKEGSPVNYQNECIRWLAKAGLNPKGCFTDVVNFMAIEAMYKGSLPQVLMMDGEQDDDGVVAMLKDQIQTGKTRVVVQLPKDSAADPIAKFYSEQGYEILRDSESRNMEALRKHHAALLKA